MGKALLGPVSEQVMVLQNIGTSVLVSPNQLPDLHQLLVEAAKLLNTEAPDLYIRQNPVPNAYTLAINGKKPFIVVHTSLVELLTRKELQAVLAHELGHLKCDHGVWLTFANILTMGAYSVPVLYHHLILILDCQEVVISVLMKLAGGCPSLADQLNVDAFLEQARSYDKAASNPVGWYIRNAQTRELSHPLPVMRAREIDEWSRSQEYKTDPRVDSLYMKRNVWIWRRLVLLENRYKHGHILSIFALEISFLVYALPSVTVHSCLRLQGMSRSRMRFLAPPSPHSLGPSLKAAALNPTARFTSPQQLGPARHGCSGAGRRRRRASPASATNPPQLSSIQSVVLDIEGTTSPISFVTDVLFPYARDNVRKHLDATYGTDETNDDIALLRAQVEQDLAEGVAGAVPVPPDEAGKDEVIDALVANVEAMIKADRKITSLKQLQGHIWRTGFEGQEIKGVVFDDVPPALEKWHASGIKTYIYSSGSREAQRLIFGNTTYGDLRKYLCGFFDTTVGTKREPRSYYEIWQSIGVDRPSQILFLTDVYQEATAAKAAGLEVLISIRPGNAPLPENHGFQTITSFAEILT
ncbi:putative bifunctional methylthioribulose-1-phosphate dehydratase/enolase-phosphatase E1 [Dichanthelium oligosanthes]|uniref:Putative bifunctional methylthioribulose-1-phosphate dehydratase/enolase-phosphatase E1 n=1 Tax=Dichanthelium oligosanthes TaxID=888268 RepID=A0A1E5W527_9POAL|nr:putative bifunctional methylthioribulose-1-phosphate dehydratase/enolase-phosphatase E1 [Dichanthelium oligosanthes]